MRFIDAHDFPVGLVLRVLKSHRRPITTGGPARPCPLGGDGRTPTCSG
jgi:hypothetical protein